MKLSALVLICVIVLSATVIGSWYLWKMDVTKGEIDLSARYDAQFNVVETQLFNMRTSIKNIHQCNDEWADKFIKVVSLQASGRGGNRANIPNDTAAIATISAGTNLQIGRESESLGIPQDLYMKLSNAVEGQLADFTRQQNVLTDIWRSHMSYCKNPYHNWLGLSMSVKVKEKPEMITSDESKEIVKTKKMSEKLF